MKLQRSLCILAVFSLLLAGCGEKHGPSVPPPDWNPNGQTTDPTDPGEDPGGETEEPEDPGSVTPPGAWEANRGKVVTPSGAGWTTRKVNDALTYYAYNGKDSFHNKNQRVYAVDLDLSNANYKVQMTYSSPSLTTSEVHKKYNSIATVNAGYEAGSIYIRVGGKDKSMLPNTHIGSTGVRNWKSEAGVFFTAGGHQAHIAAAEELIRPYVSPDEANLSSYIGKQRNYYMYNDTDDDILSSSPMLINDFNPVGETFIDYTISGWTKLSSEHPQYHQRKEHPRTAVALTENNHLILIVVDGRQTNRYGMSAKALTRFLVENFNPQYALNLDGGGSTAMCVNGLQDGDYTDKSRALVDSPIQDNKPANERARDTHIVILPVS